MWSLSLSRGLNNQWRKRYFLVATTSALLQVAKTSSSSSCPTKMGVLSFPLIEKWQQSHDSWLLRFGLPEDRKILGNDPLIPTCISVHHNSSLLDQNNNKVGLLKKSY